MAARLDSCIDCGMSEFAVDYLGSDEVYVNDNWLDIPSYSRRWDFPTENAEELLLRVVLFANSPVLDFFAGSGTTCAVAHKTGRSWIGVESGEHFGAVTLRRMKAVLAGDPGGISNQVSWKGGGAFKYLRLESYEDTLNNLELRRAPAVQTVLDGAPSAREDYLLRYMLDLETQGSASLLDVERFADPFAYRLDISEGGETRNVVVDLVETFNWLLGLRVERLRAADGYRTVEGTNPDGERVLVIWRRLAEQAADNAALEQFFTAQGYATRPEGRALDRVYVNGDCTLGNLRAMDDRCKVLLTEAEFKRLMFEA
jgi:adenine-specific DNA-methyltransferase